jgi:hypothetical protein
MGILQLIYGLGDLQSLVIRRWDYFIFGGKFYGTWFKNRK